MGRGANPGPFVLTASQFPGGVKWRNRFSTMS
jgi:hypothetical protein